MRIGFGFVRIGTDVKRATQLVKRVLRGRRALSTVRELTRRRGQLPKNRFEIGVYFADSDVNIYQMRQWYEPLKKLAESHPVLILARNAMGARALMQESGLPVQYVPKISDLEKIVAEQPLQVVFYVNQNTRNFQMMRYGRRFHVFINHGESDKMYMTSNQYKTYDYAFVAGDAARARLTRTLWDYDVETRTFEIGRPQADYFVGDAPFERDYRTVVLYAPTWEGDRAAATYGSVASHGETLVRELLASDRHRVVYRPHPRSGVVDDHFGAANQRIIHMIQEANQKDPHAQHVYDDSGSLGWQLRLPDVAICDISAMVYDRLATGKPLMVVRPENLEAEIDTSGFLQDCEWLSSGQTHEIVAEVDRVLQDQQAREKLSSWSDYYFGDTRPGAPTKRFEVAIAELLDKHAEYVAGSVDARSHDGAGVTEK